MNSAPRAAVSQSVAAAAAVATRSLARAAAAAAAAAVDRPLFMLWATRVTIADQVAATAPASSVRVPGGGCRACACEEEGVWTRVTRQGKSKICAIERRSGVRNNVVSPRLRACCSLSLLLLLSWRGPPPDAGCACACARARACVSASVCACHGE